MITVSNNNKDNTDHFYNSIESGNNMVKASIIYPKDNEEIENKVNYLSDVISRKSTKALLDTSNVNELSNTTFDLNLLSKLLLKKENQMYYNNQNTINNNSEIVSFHHHSTPEFTFENPNFKDNNLISNNLFPIEYYSRIKPGMKPSIMIKPTTKINSLFPNITNDHNLTFQNIQNEHVPNIIQRMQNSITSQDNLNLVNLINLLGSLAISSISNNHINQDFATKLKNLVEDTSSNYLITNLLEKKSTKQMPNVIDNIMLKDTNGNNGIPFSNNINLKNIVVPNNIPYTPLSGIQQSKIQIHPVHLNKLEVKYVGDVKDIINPKPNAINMEDIQNITSDISKVTDNRIKDGKIILKSFKFFKN